MFILGTEFMWSEKEKSVKGCVCVCSKLSSPCVGRWAGGFVCMCARALASEQDRVF